MKKQKSAKQDFSVEQLPHNRKEVFSDCLKVQFGTLTKLGLILFLFSLPLLLSHVTVISMLQSIVDNAELTQDEQLAMVVVVQSLGNLINVIFWIIFALGLSGIMRVIRQLAWGEYLFFAQDFWQGIKLNGKTYALTFALYGILNLANNFVSVSFNSGLLGAIPMGIFVVFFVPTGLWILTQSIVYNSKFGKYFSNGTKLYIKYFPVTLLAIVGSHVPYLILNFLPLNPLLQVLIVAVITVFVMPMGLLAWFLYSSYAFDACINKDKYPQLVGKGTYPLDSENN